MKNGEHFKKLVNNLITKDAKYNWKYWILALERKLYLKIFLLMY